MYDSFTRHTHTHPAHERIQCLKCVVSILYVVCIHAIIFCVVHLEKFLVFHISFKKWCVWSGVAWHGVVYVVSECATECVVICMFERERSFFD